jgi:CDP-glucose 4,6-dehydratase
VEALAVRREFWQHKRVLVTGHTGFKGGWMALWLHALGAQVFGYSLKANTRPNLFEQAHLEGIVGHSIGDIRDMDALQLAIDECKPDIVFHLAAQSLVRESYADPVGTYATNVLGTVHVLEAVRNQRCVRAVVIVTSDKCYDNRESGEAYRESDPMGGRDPYSSSKGCAELVTAAYRASFFDVKKRSSIAVASVRAGNVIGGGDWSADRLVPDVYRAATAGRPVRIRNPNAVRPWQHVLEPVSGYLMLAERLYDRGSEFAQGWNFGPSHDDALPVADLLTRIAKLWGGGLRWESDDGPHPHEAQLLHLDSSKARRALGWRPRLNLDEAIAWTVDWYKASQRGADMQAFTLDQISRYQRAAATA